MEIGGGKIDPSKLHLKKELTQIRKKASRALKDPGTTSSWRSPLNSARSLHRHNYLHGNACSSSSPEQFLQVRINSNTNHNDYTNSHGTSNSNYNNSGTGVVDKGSVSVKEKEKKVFLYNWRSQRSESERSKRIGEEDDNAANSSDESVGVDSSSDVRNDSKSDTCLSDKYSSALFKCSDANFTPSVRRMGVKKKPKRDNYSNASFKPNNRGKVQKHDFVSTRRAKNNIVEDLVDGLDDKEDYSNSEDFRRESTLSPLLARLKKNGLAPALRGLRKEDDLISHSTQALSTSSYNRYGARNPSVAESWDTATGSLNDADDEVGDYLDMPGQQGCGISCCWSRKSTPKSRGGYGSCCSPSLSDTLRRKGSSIFCGHHRRGHSLGSNKRRLNYPRTASQYRVPLLTNARRGSSIGSDDELSTNFGELDLEALSRLDGRRWSSSCRSQEGLEFGVNGESSPENSRSLSHKYRPMFFNEVIGQNIVVQSLTSAISRGRIAPIYLFQGPRGTGKTSTARIFTAALNCLASDEHKPCGGCRQCVDFLSGKSRYLVEVNGSNKTGVNSIKNLLKSLSVVRPSMVSQFTVVVIDECHLLPSKTWLTFLQLLEKPLPHVVFILVTTDIDNVPRTILSRCQKHMFNKISHGDIVICLGKIANEEKLEVDSDALELIASNADGSLRDAETMLDQLSLFGKRITVSLVNELIGVVSDEKLLELLELAMSSNATETVIRARELLDSGVDPIVLMSQLATLIVDIIAGTYSNADENHDSFLSGRSLSERELGRLKHALTLLSEAEKHLRVSNERSTWFTATLLQLGSTPSPDRSHSGSSRRQSSKATEDDHTNTLREANAQNQRIDAQLITEELSSHKSFSRSSQGNSTSKDNATTSHSGHNQSQFNSDKAGATTSLRCVNSEMLNDIWLQSIEKCHSKTLRQLLHSNGRLLSISETKGSFVAHIAFDDRNVKKRAEGFLSSITNAFEIVLRKNVDVKFILLPASVKTDLENQCVCLNSGADHDEAASGNTDLSLLKEGKFGVPMKRIDSIIHEQRLETAWLQAMEKGTPGSKPERNQVLPQDSTCLPREVETVNALRLTNGMAPPEDQLAKGIDHVPISPSLLHNSSFASNCNRDNMGYESGTGASGCLCWNNARTRRRGKAKQRTHLRSHKHGQFSWFGSCGKSLRRRGGAGYAR